jgi:hypothetical protein
MPRVSSETRAQGHATERELERRWAGAGTGGLGCRTSHQPRQPHTYRGGGIRHGIDVTLMRQDRAGASPRAGPGFHGRGGSVDGGQACRNERWGCCEGSRRAGHACPVRLANDQPAQLSGPDAFRVLPIPQQNPSSLTRPGTQSLIPALAEKEVDRRTTGRVSPEDATGRAWRRMGRRAGGLRTGHRRQTRLFKRNVAVCARSSSGPVFLSRAIPTRHR